MYKLKQAMGCSKTVLLLLVFFLVDIFVSLVAAVLQYHWQKIREQCSLLR
jgi:hypothetical protein